MSEIKERLREAAKPFGASTAERRYLLAEAADTLEAFIEACERCIPLLETVEAKSLVGDEGCLWPVELMRAAVAKATTHRKERAT